MSGLFYTFTCVFSILISVLYVLMLDEFAFIIIVDIVLGLFDGVCALSVGLGMDELIDFYSQLFFWEGLLVKEVGIQEMVIVGSEFLEKYDGLREMAC